MATSKRRWFAYGALGLVVLALMAAQAWPVADRVPWQTDLRTAPQAAGQRPVMLYFTADWCPPCHRMQRAVFSHGPTADAITAAAIPVKVDLTDAQPGDPHALARAMGVETIPTLVLLDTDGAELGRHSGFIGRKDLVDWLETLATTPATR